MAITKVTLEALERLATVLRQSADEILMAKENMDGLLYRIVWDDPTGLYFRSKYEEDFKPLTDKLIPNIEEYIAHISNLATRIGEFSQNTAIHISGGDTIGSILPKDSSIDPPTIDPNARFQIPDTPLEPIEHEFVIPSQEEFSDIWELHPEERIRLDDNYVLKVVPIPNGCGTEHGFGHWAGQTGAGIDAFMNSSKAGPPIVAGASLVGFALGPTVGIATLVGISKAGKVINPNEFKRLNEHACAAHDICYVDGEKLTCDKKLFNDGGRVMSLFTTALGGQAYEDAQKEGLESISFASLYEIKTGRKLILPDGYILELCQE